MKQEVKIGQTDYTVLILIRDTAGAAKTGLTYASAGIDVCYTRVETDNDVVLTAGAPVTTTLTGTHVDWGFVLVDDTNAPGLYKLDIADGVFATGAWSAVVSLICTGCDPVHIEFVLVPDAPLDGVKVASQADIDFGATQKASINAEMVDAIGTDTIAELSQGIPPITPTLKQAVMLPYMALRNETNTNKAPSAFVKIKNDAGTVVCKAALSDDETTFVKGKMESGA